MNSKRDKSLPRKLDAPREKMRELAQAEKAISSSISSCREQDWLLGKAKMAQIICFLLA